MRMKDRSGVMSEGLAELKEKSQNVGKGAGPQETHLG